MIPGGLCNVGFEESSTSIGALNINYVKSTITLQNTGSSTVNIYKIYGVEFI